MLYCILLFGVVVLFIGVFESAKWAGMRYRLSAYLFFQKFNQSLAFGSTQMFETRHPGSGDLFFRVWQEVENPAVASSLGDCGQVGSDPAAFALECMTAVAALFPEDCLPAAVAAAATHYNNGNQTERQGKDFSFQ